MSKQKEKLFVIRKYVMARTAQIALKKEKALAADEVWLDDDYKKNMVRDLSPAIGFAVENEE